RRPLPVAGIGRRKSLGWRVRDGVLDRSGGGADRRRNDACAGPAALLSPSAAAARLRSNNRSCSRLSGLVQARSDIEGRRAAQIARMGIVVRAAAMHRAAVVPDDEITHPPFVAVDEFGPGCVQIEVV